MNTAWQFNTAPWVLVLVALFLVASVWFFFRSLRLEGRTRRHVFLHLLRLAAAILVAFTLLRPEKVLTLKNAEQPRVVILWDGSGSTATNDVVNEKNQAETRASWIDRKLKEEFWKPLETRYQVSVLPFSQPPADPNAVASGELIGSDLYTPLETAARQFGDLRAVLMLTDADWNVAPPNKTPATAASLLSGRGIPVFGVAVGSETYLPDLEILSVMAPTYALLNERVSVMTTLQNRMGREVKTTITIAGPGGLTTQKQVTIPAMGQIQEMLVLQPTQEGEAEFTASVPVESGDLFPDNNQKIFRMAVRKETLKVLVVDSLPRWEYRYLRNALLRDPGVNLNTVLYHPQLGMGAGNGYLSEFPSKKEDIQSYDVIFLGDVGLNGQLKKEDCELIRGLVEQQASGVVFLPGALGNQKSLMDSPLAEMLPVEMDYAKGTGMAAQAESKLDLTFRGRDHWLTMLATDPSANQAVWKGLPGFNWYAPVLKAKPGSEVLAVHEVARNANGRIPLLVTRNFGNGKVLFMGSDSAWKWRKGVEDTYHYRFWGQVVRWMSHQRHLAQDEGIRFFYTPETPKRGDKMRLNVSVFDKLGQPVPGEKVTLNMKSPTGVSESLELAMENQEWGVHSGQFQPKEGGVYEAAISTTISGRKMTSKIDVTVPSLEKIGQPVRADVLREMAAISKGRAGGTADLEAILSQITVLPEPKSEERRFQLWCNPYWCSALLLTLTVYWVGRKMAGLA